MSKDALLILASNLGKAIGLREKRKWYTELNPQSYKGVIKYGLPVNL